VSVNAPNTPAAPPSAGQPRGRAFLWAGVAACLLGLALAVAQFGLKIVGVPWYTPVLATLGAVLLAVSLIRQRTVPRAVVLALVAALAGFEWYTLGSLLRLPAYDGPARPGRPFPAFRAAYADSRPFTDADLRDGSRRVMVFFRGRW
jgi:hypothetical protein